jgi:hypothetical protein
MKLPSLPALLLPLLFPGSLLTGCADSTTTPAMVDGGAPDALETHLTVWVVEPGDAPGQPPKPIVNAAIAYTAPGSDTPADLTTGADGSLVVSGDFTKGAATVTAFSPGHRALTMLDVTIENVAKLEPTRGFPKPNDLVLFLSRKAASASATAKLSGMLSGKLADDDFITLSTTTGRASFQDQVPNYSFAVTKGAPFSIIGLEWRLVKRGTDGALEQPFSRWFRIDHEALTADAALDIDVSKQTPLTPQDGTVRLTIPGGATGLLGTGSYGYVTVASAGGAFIGAPQKIGPNADGTAHEGTLQWVLPDGIPATSVSYTSFVSALDNSTYSIVMHPGFPPAALLVDDFPVPPVTSQDSVQTGGKITFTSVFKEPRGGECSLAVQNSQQLWQWNIASAAGDATTFTIPTLTPTIRDGLPKAALTGVIACLRNDPDGGYHESVSPLFDFTP